MRVTLYSWLRDKGHPSVHDIQTSLPISPAQFEEIRQKLDATKEEILIHSAECALPVFNDVIDREEVFDTVNAFAQRLEQAAQTGQLPLYKAMLEADECGSLEKAILWGNRLSEFRLEPGVSTPHQLGELFLKNEHGPQAEKLAEYVDMREYGKAKAAECGAVQTRYGYLFRVDNGMEQSQACTQPDEQDLPQEQSMM